jgi:hypothetical protein
MRTLTLLFIALAASSASWSQLSLDAETGGAIFGYNNIRIPGDAGTDFSIADDNFLRQLTPFFRGRVSYTIGERHTVSALYAPLVISARGTFEEPVRFNNEIFAQDIGTYAKWKFNSYRLSYQYAFFKRERLTLAAGLTGKIRDAEISLHNPYVESSKKNVGFVPLVRFYGDWTIAPGCHVILDGDALASKQGRAEDILLAVGYDANDFLRLKFGYRMLEGGADNDEVYNFSLVNYATVGVMATF